ncbi:hypothetical protein D3C87_2096780 [compost metagenome]
MVVTTTTQIGDLIIVFGDLKPQQRLVELQRARQICHVQRDICKLAVPEWKIHIQAPITE